MSNLLVLAAVVLLVALLITALRRSGDRGEHADVRNAVKAALVFTLALEIVVDRVFHLLPITLMLVGAVAAPALYYSIRFFRKRFKGN